MTEPRNQEDLRFNLHIDGLPSEGRVVTAFQIDEGLSSIYHARVAFDTKDEAVVPDLLGKSASLIIGTGDERAERCFHGEVVSASVRKVDELEWRVCTIDIAPRVARCQLGANCRIFQELAVPDVVTKVLEDAGLPADSFSWDLDATYPVHPYITQLNESDHDFILRLLHEEGIGFALRNDIDAELLVFFDDNGQLVPLAEDAPVPFSPVAGPSHDRIIALRERYNAASDEVMLRDYDPLKPSTDLSFSDRTEESTGREVYHHPGGFTDPADGRRRATATLQRRRLRARVISGLSNVPYLEPGRTFDLIGHPRAELNDRYVVTRVVHRGGWTGGDRRASGSRIFYENDFETIPRATPYRPDRRTEPPHIGGVQLAFVSGPRGAELHGSENGQVKVRFPWDRSGIDDDKSSTWLRVGQLPLQGSMVVPRVGFEVLVDCEMGDHDRPMVVGHLYNGEAMPPYELPGGATKSSIQTATTEGGAGANELRFEDATGSEQILMNASHDFTCSVEHDAVSGVIANESSTIGGNSVRSVTANCTFSVGGDRSLTVGGNQNIGVGADLTNATGGALSTTVGSRNESVGGDLAESTTGTYSRTVGGLQSLTGIAGVARNIVGASTTKVGGAWTEVTAGDRSSTCGTARVESVGALKMTKAETVAISCGAAYAQNSATESIKAGGNVVYAAGGPIAIAAGGGVKIKATNVNISGKSKVVFRVGGTSITVKPDSVTIKSGSVNMTGVKALKSTSHETA